jgi:hypothetical protein
MVGRQVDAGQATRLTLSGRYRNSYDPPLEARLPPDGPEFSRTRVYRITQQHKMRFTIKTDIN